MAKTNINLNMTSVENREYRLGTIIGWDGKASDLIKESAYDERSAKKHGGCAGKGPGCKLCELRCNCAVPGGKPYGLRPD